MTKLRFTLKIVTAFAVCMWFNSLAQAQATRTWVSGVGDDANPCSRTAPCKTFAGAISKTATGGEISVLDPGGFGALTITKAITIDGGTGSGWGSVLASGANGIIVNAPANAIVILRHLSINGTLQSTSPGINGIRFLAGKSLEVSNCEIFGFGTHGIDAFSLASASELHVKDTTIANCANTGISVQTTVGPALVSIDNVRIERCSAAVNSGNGTRTQIRNSAFTNNTFGVLIGNGGLAADATIVGTKISNVDKPAASVGVQANGGGVGRIGECTIANYATGALANGGSLFTDQQNWFINNTSDGSALTLIPRR